ncbi:MAG: hypothetical protein HY966_06015, partial [Ignavibacteriales bacterium]|nr:hypothetical protein [Ignavibacteriales bacterium]
MLRQIHHPRIDVKSGGDRCCCIPKFSVRFPLRGYATRLLSILTTVIVVIDLSVVNAQNRRMLIEGNVQVDGFVLSSSSTYRILRSDSTIAASATPYSSSAKLFAIRISNADGFAEGDRILFRVVVSKRDSFIARTLGPGLTFRGTDAPESPPVYTVNLFRNHPPSFRRTIPDTGISEMQPLRYRVIASDLDADTVRYELVQAPSETSINPLSGLVTWTPSYDDAGIQRFVVEASDG